MKRRLILLIALILILLLGTIPVLAQGSGAGVGRVVFGSNLVLSESDFVDGDVLVFGGNLVAERGSKIDGDVVVFGGTASIDGKVDGDVVVIGGTVSVNGKVKGDVATLGGAATIGPEARIAGDIATAGGVASIDDAAEIGGSVVDGPGTSSGAPTSVPLATPGTPSANPPIPPITYRGPTFGERLLSFVGDGVQDIIISAFLAGLAVLMVIFFPSHVKTVERTLKSAGVVSGAIGVGTMAAVVIFSTILTILIITICLLPFFGLVVAAALLLGTAALGKMAGEYIFARVSNHTPTPIAATVVGVGALALLGRMPFMDNLPWIGWAFAVVGFFIQVGVISLALGSVVLTRFGTQPYLSSAKTPSAPPVGYPELPAHAPIVPPAPEDAILKPDDTPSFNDTIAALDDLLRADDDPEDDTPSPDDPKAGSV